MTASTSSALRNCPPSGSPRTFDGGTATKCGALTPEAPRPVTLPVVIHNGAAPWRVPRRLADWTLAGLPDAPRTDLAPLQPSIGLHVVDFAAHRGDDLIAGSLTTLQQEDEDMSVGVFRSRIDENMKRATEAWFADGLKAGLERGLEQGLEQGLERGLEQQRSLLGRQAAAKFGAETAVRLTPLLAQAGDWATLAELGEVLLAAGDEPQLLAQTKAAIASSQQGPD